MVLFDSTSPPPDAQNVVLVHDGGPSGSVRLRLDAIAQALFKRRPDGCGHRSLVWRFSVPALAARREPQAGEPMLALKMVELFDDARLRHLPCEFATLSRFASPYFPRARAHGLLKDKAYLLVTEWVEGRNLALHGPAVVRDLAAADQFDRFCGDLMQIRKALTEAGVVHSDIYEANIIERDLRPVLIDFGWSREPGEPPLRDNMHQPDDDHAIFQLMLRLGALRRMVVDPPIGRRPNDDKARPSAGVLAAGLRHEGPPNSPGDAP